MKASMERPSASRNRLLAAIVYAMCNFSCATSVSRESVDAPYQGGEAFPNRMPKLTLPRGELGFVSNSFSDTIDLIDLTRGTRISSTPIGRNPVDIDGPHHVAVDTKNQVAYTAFSYPDSSATVGGAHAAHGGSKRLGYLQQLSLDFLAPTTGLILDENPGDIAISADGARVVVSHFDLRRANLATGERRANLVVAKTSSFAQTPVPDPLRIRVCRAPHGIALSKSTPAIAYIACYADDAIAIVDLIDSAKPVRMVPLGASVNDGSTPLWGPYSVVLSPSGKLLVVASTEAKVITVFDTETMTARGQIIDTSGAPYLPAFGKDENRLYVPTQNPDGFREVDLTTGATVRFRRTQIEECEKPHEVGFFGEQALYVVCEGNRTTKSTVLTFDSASFEPRSRIEVGVYPDRLAFLKIP
jgi:DNA-binding beta-propeller fold protein YncE